MAQHHLNHSSKCLLHKNVDPNSEAILTGVIFINQKTLNNVSNCQRKGKQSGANYEVRLFERQDGEFEIHLVPAINRLRADIDTHPVLKRIANKLRREYANTTASKKLE